VHPNNDPIKICFSPEKKCPEGYNPDSGETLKLHDGGLEYGWGKDMRSMVRSRDKNVQPDPLLANCILFAPNENNPLCTKPNPDVPCSPVEWSYKVPEIGTYNVKITTGDAEKKNVESLAVNGKMIFDNLVLEPNQFDSAEIEV